MRKETRRHERAKASVYNKLSAIEAEVSQAKAVLQGVQTYVEYHFQDEACGELQSIISGNAENVQVLLSVMKSMLDRAEAEAEELYTMLHGAEEKSVCA